jgi:hypothetical protein
MEKAVTRWTVTGRLTFRSRARAVNNPAIKAFAADREGAEG